MNNREYQALLAGCLLAGFVAHLTQAQGIVDPIPGAIPASSLQIELQPIATGLTSPNTLTEAPDASGRFFIADQTGQVRVIDGGQLQSTPFLDVGVAGQNLLVNLNANYDERGLLGMAFHPDFGHPSTPGYGKFYTYTSEPATGTADFTVPLPSGTQFNHQSVIREWTMDNTSSDVFSGTSRELIRIDEPQFNHNAGALHFGPQDGLLYVSLGDGGMADDQGPGHVPDGNAQTKSNILGSIVRIDPLGTNSANGQYGIPANNPFVGDADTVPEIFAYGLRNPFRFSFDSQTGQLVIGEVGQNAIEEVDRIDPGTQAGTDFGWHAKEGTFTFDPNGDGPGIVTANSPGVPATLDGDPVVDPVLQYDHDEGIAVLGGYVYHGDLLPQLSGQYIFGDLSRGFGSPDGRLFLGDLDVGTIQELLVGANKESLEHYLLGFGQDHSGEVYVLASQNIGPHGNTGVVYKLVPEPASFPLLALASMGLAFVKRAGGKSSPT